MAKKATAIFSGGLISSIFSDLDQYPSIHDPQENLKAFAYTTSLMEELSIGFSSRRRPHTIKEPFSLSDQREHAATLLNNQVLLALMLTLESKSPKELLKATLVTLKSLKGPKELFGVRSLLELLEMGILNPQQKKFEELLQLNGVSTCPGRDLISKLAKKRAPHGPLKTQVQVGLILQVLQALVQVDTSDETPKLVPREHSPSKIASELSQGIVWPKQKRKFI